MSFTYSQTHPYISRNGAVISGSPIYSGHGAGLNNPDMEAMPNIGPIPAGQWRIVAWHDTWENKGPIVAQLEPVNHDAHGRSGFLIHGDNAAGDFTASDGCIIAPRVVRNAMRDFGDTDLLVVSGVTEELVA